MVRPVVRVVRQSSAKRRMGTAMMYAPGYFLTAFEKTGKNRYIIDNALTAHAT